MLQIIVTFLALAIAFSNASLFCPHTKMPSDHKSFETLRIQLKKAVGQEPIYRLANIEDTDKSFTISSPKFRLITRTDNIECPSKGCITELSAAQPKLQSSILYLTNIIGKMIPPGFHHIETSTRLYCVIMAGDCGATVPIYRYYKFLPSGLYHAYSTNEDIEIEGYVREPQPLCYGWKTLSNEQLRAEGIVVEGSGEESGEDFSSEEETEVTEQEKEEGKKEEFKMQKEVCNDKTPPKPSSLKSLNVYVNDKSGALKDHYYTTKIATVKDQKDSESEFYGYSLDEKVSNLGMVVVDEEKSKCGCLIRLSQMLDEQTGMFTRKDHKLAADFKEPPPSGGEKYVTLDEEVFCVREQGACGANVALRKYFNILELDTVYTVNKTDIPPLTVPSPPGILCFIWPYQKPHKKDPKKEEIVKKQKTTTKKPATTTVTSTSKPKTTATPSTTKNPTTTTPTSSSSTTSTTTLNPKTTISTTKKVVTTPVATPSTTPSTTIASSTKTETSAPTTTVQTTTEKSSTVKVEATTSSATVSPATTTIKKESTTAETKTTKENEKKEAAAAKTTTTPIPKTANSTKKA